MDYERRIKIEQLKRNVTKIFDDQIEETYIMIGYEVQRLFESTPFNIIDSRDIRYLVNRYFNNMNDYILSELNNYLEKIFAIIDNFHETQKLSDISIEDLKSSMGIEDFITNTMHMAMYRGLNNLESEFMYNLQDVCRGYYNNEEIRMINEQGYFRKISFQVLAICKDNIKESSQIVASLSASKCDEIVTDYVRQVQLGDEFLIKQRLKKQYDGILDIINTYIKKHQGAFLEDDNVKNSFNELANYLNTEIRTQVLNGKFLEANQINTVKDLFEKCVEKVEKYEEQRKKEIAEKVDKQHFEQEKQRLQNKLDFIRKRTDLVKFPEKEQEIVSLENKIHNSNDIEQLRDLEAVIDGVEYEIDLEQRKEFNNFLRIQYGGNSQELDTLLDLYDNKIEELKKESKIDFEELDEIAEKMTPLINIIKENKEKEFKKTIQTIHTEHIDNIASKNPELAEQLKKLYEEQDQILYGNREITDYDLARSKEITEEIKAIDNVVLPALWKDIVEKCKTEYGVISPQVDQNIILLENKVNELIQSTVPFSESLDKFQEFREIINQIVSEANELKKQTEPSQNLVDTVAHASIEDTEIKESDKLSTLELDQTLESYAMAENSINQNPNLTEEQKNQIRAALWNDFDKYVEQNSEQVRHR